MSKKFFLVTREKTKNKVWTKSEDYLLLSIINNIGCKWKFILKYFQNRTILQLYSRYTKINPNLKKGKFSKEEDKEIIDLVNIYGTNWCKIANILKNRTSKQIRSRYVNYLNKIYDNTEISEEEKETIFLYYPKLGNKWTEYSKILPRNRSAKFLRNKFFQLIK